MAGGGRQGRRGRREETAAEGLHRLLGKQWAVVRANEPRARRGSVKGLHDIRVALRRLRTLTATFAEVDEDFLKTLDKRASKVCDRMGDARDLDVWIELFRDLEKAGGLEGLTKAERRGVLAELRAARTRLAAEALDCGAFHRVKQMLRERLRRAPRRDATAPTLEMLAARRMRTVRGLIEERYRKVGLYSREPAHDLRRSGRRMRYIAEFFAERIGPEAVRAGRWITRAQAALGKMHDCDNALDLSRDLPTGKARAAVRRGLRKRRMAQLAKFKVAWRHYANRRLQERFGRRLEAVAAGADA